MTTLEGDLIDMAQIECLAQAIAPGCAVLRAWPLIGGISAQTTAFEIASPEGRRQRLVTRQFGMPKQPEDPEGLGREFQLLQALHALGLSVPRPRHFEVANGLSSWPVLVERKDGA